MKIKPYAISLDQVKSYLQISDTTYDTQIELYLPIVSDDLTRKNGICNQSFLIESTATADETDTLTNVSLSTSEWDSLYTGSNITIDGIDGIISSFDDDAETITLEAATTATGDDLELLIRNFPTGAKPVVSQMILFKFNNGSISGATYGNEVASISSATTSVSYAGKNGTVNGYGYPDALTKQLAPIRKPRFF
jgi:hypothetical protein